MSKASVLLILVVAVGLVVGCAVANTERHLLEWAPVLNVVMGAQGGKFPDSLDAIPPEVRETLTSTDGWGNEFLYRKLRLDLYNLISAGPDGEFGNDDDIIVENGRLTPASKVYGEFPLKK